MPEHTNFKLLPYHWTRKAACMITWLAWEKAPVACAALHAWWLAPASMTCVGFDHSYNSILLSFRFIRFILKKLFFHFISLISIDFHHTLRCWAALNHCMRRLKENSSMHVNVFYYLLVMHVCLAINALINTIILGKWVH